MHQRAACFIDFTLMHRGIYIYITSPAYANIVTPLRKPNIYIRHTFYWNNKHILKEAAIFKFHIVKQQPNVYIIRHAIITAPQIIPTSSLYAYRAPLTFTLLRILGLYYICTEYFVNNSPHCHLGLGSFRPGYRDWADFICAVVFGYLLNMMSRSAIKPLLALP